MNEEEKDSIEILKNTDLDINTIDIVDLHTYNYAVKIVLNLLEKKDIDIIETKEANRQLSVELQKKDKVIELAVKNNVGACLNVYCKNRNNKDKCIKCIIENYERKVESEEK